VPWELVGIVLWAGLAVGLALGVLAVTAHADGTVLGSGLVSVALITGFSWLAVLSIGPFTIAAAVLVASGVLTRRYRPALRAAGMAAGFAAYVLITWTPWPARSLALIILPAASVLGVLIGGLAGGSGTSVSRS
jgi:hypothetical protein